MWASSRTVRWSSSSKGAGCSVRQRLEETGCLSHDAQRRFTKSELPINGAPEFSYYLNYNGLDRYNREGITFLFDRAAKTFSYDGGAWCEIIRRYPNSPEAAEARKRMEAVTTPKKPLAEMRLARLGSDSNSCASSSFCTFPTARCKIACERSSWRNSLRSGTNSQTDSRCALAYSCGRGFAAAPTFLPTALQFSPY